MKILVLIAVVLLANAAYAPKDARWLAYLSGICYSTADQINKWNCTDCAAYPLKNVKFILILD
jgi:hypothetical protein